MKKFVFVVFLMFSEEIYLFNSRAELKVFIYFPWPTLLTLCLKFNVFLHYLDTMSTVTFKTVHKFLCSNVECCHQSGLQDQYQLMRAKLDLNKSKIVFYWETTFREKRKPCKGSGGAAHRTFFNISVVTKKYKGIRARDKV